MKCEEIWTTRTQGKQGSLNKCIFKKSYGREDYLGNTNNKTKCGKYQDSKGRNMKSTTT